MTEFIVHTKGGFFVQTKFLVKTDGAKIKTINVDGVDAHVTGVGELDMKAYSKGGISSEKLVDCKGQKIYYIMPSAGNNALRSEQTQQVKKVRRN